MKKMVLALAGLVVLLSACDKEVPEEVKEKLESLNDFELGSAQFSAEFGTAQDAMAAFSGRPSKPDFDCATFSHDSANKTVTLDFGTTPCAGKDGKKRSGVMKIQFSGNFRNPDADRVVTFSDYKVDSATLNGFYSYTPLDSTADGDPKFSITITDGSLVLDNGKSIEFEVDRTWVWTAGAGSKDSTDDEWMVTGTAKGTSGSGTAYEIEIDASQGLLYKTTCWSSSIYYPVSGSVTIQEDRKTYSVNYGTGSCDKEAEITRGKVTWTQELP